MGESAFRLLKFCIYCLPTVKHFIGPNFPFQPNNFHLVVSTIAPTSPSKPNPEHHLFPVSKSDLIVRRGAAHGACCKG